ncbi:O-antigen ligase family protein [Aliarcobacter butzleri]|uniref:O-antigen ligase family protein n=1 Tax=Aliarcobacter butzleri TaxID=28197 RepID=UPI00263DC5F4|nr:O-antigen ligase family protein [Aliarcobacter butzleri]MDN5061281.1 O-antigen ligase family protein [Aliarcobacter butzleri]MDN5081928.1 O-antigen ligase family protein [Aliarcobacter butzleri]MDN5084238.1 O-antigen ligase family protein [Aliarcobacter butzleri]
MSNKLNLKYEYLNITFLFIVISIFFIPPILNINNIYFRIDDIVILFILPFTILLFYKELTISIYLKILSSVFLSMLFSTLYGYIVLDVPFNMRDVNELIRMLKPLLLFSFLLLIDKGIYKEILFKFLILAMMFFIFVGLSESLKIPYLNDFFINIYSSEFQDGVGRINATTLNPNDGAVITLFFLFFSISMLITYRKYYYMISSILLIYILLNTGSRTAFLIAIVFFLLFFIFTKAISVKNKIILLIFIFIGLISIYPYMSSYINRILTLLNAIQLKDASLNIRFGLWKDALEIFYQSKIFGWGVAKGIHDTVVDGEHFILLRRYGLIGFSLVILAMIYPLYVIKQRIRINQLDSKEKVLYYTLFAYLGSGLFVMFTNNFFTHYILVFPYILIAPVLFKR